MTIHHLILSATLFVLLQGCLYDGKGTEGLPCNVHGDCDALSCIEGFCGESPGGFDGESSGVGGSGEGSDDENQPPPQQELPEPCSPGLQQCVGESIIQWCTEDRKLITWGCERSCGMDNPVDGGCQTSPDDGKDYCWCESTGGPPSGTCRQSCSSSSDCSPGERCLSTLNGDICLPMECIGCFSDDRMCSSYGLSCTFIECA